MWVTWSRYRVTDAYTYPMADRFFLGRGRYARRISYGYMKILNEH